MAGLMIIVPMCVKPMTRPSGSACASNSFEITPFAPGRLSTMTCWPSAALIFGWMIRATRSVAPPGGKPTIMRTGRGGAHSPASPVAGNQAAHTAAATVRCSGVGKRNEVRLGMVDLLT